jgi:3-oxoadipate enol-lactonase
LAIANIRDRFQILRYDCRGQGKSDKPESIYSLNDHVDDLDFLLKKCELKNEDIILIGLSNGGRIVLQYSTTHKVRATIALDTYDIVTPLLKAKLNSWHMASETGGPMHRFDIATPWIWGEEVFNLKSELILSYREKAIGTLPHVVRGLILGALETDIDLGLIRNKVLFCVGREDLLTPPFNHEKMVKKCLDAELIIVDGGHASLIERPNIMDKNLIPWIENL